MKNNNETLDEIEINTKNIKKLETDEKIETLKTEMSKGQKLFWIIILLFMIIYIILSIFASNNVKDLISKRTNVPFIHKYITTYLPDDTIKNNISKGESIINIKLNEDLDTINAKIDKEVDELFAEVEKNVDVYLDFHYSVYGEYSELVSLAASDLNEEIQSKLFGSEFNQIFENKMNSINALYEKKIEEHIKLINDIGIEGVDKELNNDSLEYMINDIENFRNLIIGKSLILGTTIGAKIALAISAKIAAKAVTKAAGKVALKTTSKFATSGAAAAAGLWCGPLFWVCSPVAATAAWFGTDAIVVTADEMLNRDDFKIEIISSLDESKNEIKYNLKKSTEEQFKMISDKVKKSMEDSVIIKKERVRVGDKIEVLFNTPQEAIDSIKENK